MYGLSKLQSKHIKWIQLFASGKSGQYAKTVFVPTDRLFSLFYWLANFRPATRVLVAPMTFMMTQQRTSTICNPKLIAIFARLENVEGD